MKKTIFLYPLALTLPALLSACGGSSSSDNDSNNGNVVVTPGSDVEIPTLEKTYKLSDYSNDSVSTADLTGTWVAITDVSGKATIEGTSMAVRSNERVFFVIRQNENQLEISNCANYLYIADSENGSSGTGFTTISLQGNTFDDGLFRTITVTNNNQLSYSYSSSASLQQTVGQTWQTEAIKISDSVLPVGTMTTQMAGFDNENTEMDLYCIAQENSKVSAKVQGFSVTDSGISYSAGFEHTDEIQGIFELEVDGITSGEPDISVIVENSVAGHAIRVGPTDDNQIATINHSLSSDTLTGFSFEAEIENLDLGDSLIANISVLVK